MLKPRLQLVGGNSPLHYAAEGGDDGLADILLRAGANPLTQNSRGFTPLHLSALCGSKAVANVLLSGGADPHVRDRTGHNAAYWAKEFNHLDVVAVS